MQTDYDISYDSTYCKLEKMEPTVTLTFLVCIVLFSMIYRTVPTVNLSDHAYIVSLHMTDIN
ncbi:hypothetical protein BCR42DRAFT_409145 [Absidia repens]|uniref:Uncharacterized protein n=1 Tax=Absidia repens TaxID=90262 RepID=A0A1X2IQP4_9FUNG|nr:hypothetical protein BCR42DRAFT_409145 [Absidia repens]